MSGAFSSAFSGAFDVGAGVVVPTGPQVRLVFDGSIDDHERPRRPPLWQYVRPVPSQRALLLFKDGTVLQRTVLVAEEYYAADWVAAGGHVSIFNADDWQTQVLTDAGYVLEPVT